MGAEGRGAVSRRPCRRRPGARRVLRAAGRVAGWPLAYEVDRTLYALPESENQRIFRKDIVRERLAGTPQRRPVVVFVAGQTGAGKTAVTKLVMNALARGGRPVNLDLDKYKPYHPRYSTLLVADETTV